MYELNSRARAALALLLATLATYNAQYATARRRRALRKA